MWYIFTLALACYLLNTESRTIQEGPQKVIQVSEYYACRTEFAIIVERRDILEVDGRKFPKDTEVLFNLPRTGAKQ